VFVNYAPKGEPAQQWEYSPEHVRAAEAELIEKRFDGTFDQFNMALLQGSMRARRVLLWHMLKRKHLELRLEDVDFASGELKVEFTRDELQQMHDEAATSKAIPDKDRDLMLLTLRAQIDKAPAGDTAGKAPSKKRA
jgi:hypothetical protein